MRLLKYTANAAVLFDDDNALRRIVSGTADFFLVRFEDGHPCGHRRYVFTLGDNMLVPVFEAKRGEESYRLMGVAGSPLLVWEQDSCDGLVCEAAMRTFACCLPAVGETAERAQKLSRLAPLELDSGERMENDCREGVWVQAEEGSACLNGCEGIRLLPKRGYLPLPSRTFVDALAFCRLSVCTSERFASLPDAAMSIRHSLRTSLNLALDSVLERETLEQERIRRRREYADAEFDTSLRDLTRVFCADSGSVSATGPLTAALAPICRELGVPLRIPADGAQNLERLLDAIGLRSRDVVLKDRWWSYDCGILLAWREEDSVPVALIPSGHGYRLYASGAAPVRVTAAVADSLKSGAKTLYVPLPSHPLAVGDIARYMLRRICPRDVVLYGCAGAGVAVLSLAVPAVTEVLCGIIVPRQDAAGLYAVCFFLAAAVVASALLRLSQLMSHLLLETKSAAPLQAAVWDRLFHLPVAFFKRHGSGELLRRASGVESMQRLLSDICMQGALNAVALICGFVLMLYYNAALALVTAGCLLVVMIPLFHAGLAVGRREHDVAEGEAESTGILLQIIQGIAKFRSTCTETKAFSLWERSFARLLRFQYQRDCVEARVSAVAAMLFPCFLLLLYVLYMTGRFGAMTTGRFLAFSASFSSVAAALADSCRSAEDIGRLGTYYRRLQPLLQECPEGASSAASPGTLRGNIELRNVTFRYAPELPAVVRNFTLSIPAGSFVAITGGSGCGKSTLIRLLLGFETPEAGTVSYDGQNLSLVDCRQVRRQLGVVLQNGKILGDDILTNIIGTSASLSVDDAWKAAELAGIADDIREMPMGMYTVVGENGGTLSGGQRQRLLIARALAAKPKVLIFDEATSALDNRTQAAITARIDALHCTRVVVAHRLSTIRNADKIYYLANGSVAESGTYSQLMARKGLFYEMASRQIT